MPLIEFFNGIKIYIYNGEHRPPHFHAKYGEFEIVILIETKKIYAGEMPNKQLKKIFDWIEENSDWALQVFNELNPELS